MISTKFEREFWMNKGQGTLELIVILAVIVVVALSIAVYSTDILGSSASQVSITASKRAMETGSQSGEIKVMEVVSDSTGDAVIRLMNAGEESFTITGISSSSGTTVPTVGNSFSPTKVMSNESATFALDTIANDCKCTTAGLTKTCIFDFNITSKYGILKTIQVPVVIDCVNEVLPIGSTIDALIPDLNAPIISGTNPSPLAIGTTSYDLTITTDENATCKYSTSVGIEYASMAHTFTGSILSHTATITELAIGDNNIYSKCSDTSNNANQTDFITIINVLADTSAPIISGTNPSPLSFGTTSYDLTLTTDENATCKYSTTAGVAYVSMNYDFNGSALSHVVTVSGLTAGVNNFYVRCLDDSNNANLADFVLTVTVLQPPLFTPFVWAANFNTNQVAKVDLLGNVLGDYNVANNPRCIAVDLDGNVWVSTNSTNKIYKVSSDGVVLGSFTLGGSSLEGVTIAADGNIWVANNSLVYKLNPSGSILGTFTVGANPRGIAASADGNVWVANFGGNSVSKLNPSGTVLGTFNVGTRPAGIAVDGDGNVWVTNSVSGTVSKLSSLGVLFGTTTVGSYPKGIAVDMNGNVWVANNSNNYVSKLSSSGAVLGNYTVGGFPYGVAIDENNNVWVTNTGSSLSKLNSSGMVIATVPSAENAFSIGDFTGFALQYFVLGRR
ncbi:MAG: NHL repeat-containing protein [Candidatus Diapherotrites archaeon]|nr:NHL repeat-containing protein [Candidatus Diapherotrites archaeon]